MTIALSQLFGDDEEGEGEDELDAAEKAGENGKVKYSRDVLCDLCTPASEISALRKEAQAFKIVRKALRVAPISKNGDFAKSGSVQQLDPARLAFDKV